LSKPSYAESASKVSVTFPESIGKTTYSVTILAITIKTYIDISTWNSADEPNIGTI
jgi:hypothetical protein